MAEPTEPPKNKRRPREFVRLGKLLRALSRRRRVQLGLLLIGTLIGGLAEMMSIGLVLPFLVLLSDPDRIYEFANIQRTLGRLGIVERDSLVNAMMVLFGLAILLSAAIRIALQWANKQVIYQSAKDMQMDLLSRVLYQPLDYHLRHNSSDTLAAANRVQIVAVQYMTPWLDIVSAVIISAFILTALMMANFLVATTIFVGVTVIYGLVMLLTRQEMSRIRRTLNDVQPVRIQLIQEALGGIRDVILDRSQELQLERYQPVEESYRNAQVKLLFIGVAPRYVVESLGILIIIVVTFFLNRQQADFSLVVPTLATVALGGQRMIPMLQQTYASLTKISGATEITDDVLRLLKLETRPARPGEAPMVFEQQIELMGIGYAYPGSGRMTLHDVDLTIPKGCRLGIIGTTGSGKSTLTDVMMGLLEPSAGEIRVDGAPVTRDNQSAWRQNIAHVPQSIYLSDKSIAENIAVDLSAEKIDMERVEAAARLAGIHDFIVTLPEGYWTPAGERGVRMSGGQRQRLGLARALHQKKPILVLDEATSALDSATETQVMAAINGLPEKITMIIVAHRISTLANCDLVIRMHDGQIVQRGRFEDVVQEMEVSAADD